MDKIDQLSEPAKVARSFMTEQQVRFSHIDPAGIAYFPRIFNFVHEAFENLWEEFMCVRYDDLIHKERLGFPLVHAESDFKRGLHFGDRPVVEVTCIRLGRSSLGLRYCFWVNEVLCVDIRATTVCVDLDTMQSCPIPETYRQRFQEIMAPDVSSN